MSHRPLRPTRSRSAVRLLAAAAVTACLAGGLTACGDDSDDNKVSDTGSSASAGDTSGTPDGTDDDSDGSGGSDEGNADDGDTDSDFVARANTICETLYPSLNQAFSDLASAAEGDVAMVVTDEFLPAANELQTQLSTLSPPADAAQLFEQALDAQQDQIDTLTDDPSAINTLDPSVINSSFDELGLSSCGSNSGSFQ